LPICQFVDLYYLQCFAVLVANLTKEIP